METGLVSICVPCYNVAPYISRFLDSLLAQTYRQLELILVNDGATDDTGAVMERYLPRLEAAGYRVVYLVQENAGQAAAINNALKHVHGEFLAWPDPDDWLTPDSIETRVRFLQSHPEVALVRGNAAIIRESDGRTLATFEPPGAEAHEMEDFAQKLLLLETWFAPVSTLLRTACFLTVNPQKEIFTTRLSGQNMQLMVPVAHRFPCWQLPEVLGYYLVRQNSHSRVGKTAEAQFAYIDAREEIALHELSLIPELEQTLRRAVLELDNLQRFWVAVDNREKTRARQYLKQAGKRGLACAWLYAHTCLPLPLGRALRYALDLAQRGVGALARRLGRSGRR